MADSCGLPVSQIRLAVEERLEHVQRVEILLELDDPAVRVETEQKMVLVLVGAPIDEAAVTLRLDRHAIVLGGRREDRHLRRTRQSREYLGSHASSGLHVVPARGLQVLPDLPEARV